MQPRLKFGTTCVYFLSVAVHQDSCLVSRGLKFLPIPFFVGMVEVSREPKR